MPISKVALPNKVVLIGFMGSGKTTLGKELAGLLNWRFIDTDKCIVKKEKRSIKKIFQDDGESCFRKVESQMIVSQMDERDAVIALGGGAVTTDAVRRTIKRSDALVIWLQIAAHLALKRTTRAMDRPLLNGVNRSEVIQSLMRSRKKFYRMSADVAVNSGTIPDAQTLISRVPMLRRLYSKVVL